MITEQIERDGFPVITQRVCPSSADRYPSPISVAHAIDSLVGSCDAHALSRVLGPAPSAFSTQRSSIVPRLHSPKQVTDAYLLAPRGRS